MTVDVSSIVSSIAAVATAALALKSQHVRTQRKVDALHDELVQLRLELRQRRKVGRARSDGP